MTTPENARDLLSTADNTSRRAAGFNLSWLTYAFLCAGGAVTAIGLTYADVANLNPLAAWLAGGAWIFMGVAFIGATVTMSPPTRRGFNSRWTTMMILWAIMWAVVCFFHDSFSLGIGAAVSCVFLALALIGALWEIVTVNRGVK